MGTEQGISRALIFGSAPCEDWAFLEDYLQLGPWTVLCADGGVHSARRAGVSPHFLIGDWDSGGSPLSGVPTVSLPREKDMTDLQAAVDHALDQGARLLLLCGCTGGRLDHTLANLELLERISQRGGTGLVVDPENEVRYLPPGRLLLENRPAYRYLSLLPLDEALEGVCLRGVKYPLEQARLIRGDTLPVSNEITGGRAEICICQGRGLIVRSQRIK